MRRARARAEVNLKIASRSWRAAGETARSRGDFHSGRGGGGPLMTRDARRVPRAPIYIYLAARRIGAREGRGTCARGRSKKKRDARTYIRAA